MTDIRARIEALERRFPPRPSGPEPTAAELVTGMVMLLDFARDEHPEFAHLGYDELQEALLQRYAHKLATPVGDVRRLSCGERAARAYDIFKRALARGAAVDGAVGDDAHDRQGAVRGRGQTEQNGT